MPEFRILIVEDELIVALELEDRLRRHGYSIVGTARSADEALALARAQPVDLALLDLRLAGGRDGVELAHDLRAREIPFVFLTAHGDDETLERVKATEPLGYLLKPFDGRLLRLTIETALHRHVAERGRVEAERAQARLEQQLARARQLEIAGRVASGIAHDLNNLLSVVWMSTYMLRQAKAPELPCLLDELEGAVKLGASLTARLLSVARHDDGQPRALAVNDALGAIARLAKRALSAGVKLNVELDPEVGVIFIDPAKLDQVVLNLALNSDRAMPEGGQLTLRSRAGRRAGAPAVVVEVEDTGVGIDADIQARIFEPFFSTRSEAGGIGLGLAIVKDIVEQAGGALEFESALGRGTVFRASFPRHAAGESSAGTAGDGEIGIDGRGCAVLLVDDDEQDRGALARVLEVRGFRVVHARGSGDAMLIAEREHEPLALALVDLELPYMDGAELSGRLKQLRGELPVVLLSGSAKLGERPHASVDAILRKPLEPASLFAEFARLLPRALARVGETR